MEYIELPSGQPDSEDGGEEMKSHDAQGSSQQKEADRAEKQPKIISE